MLARLTAVIVGVVGLAQPPQVVAQAGAQAGAQAAAPTAEPITGAVAPCVNGTAHGFSCQNVDLLSFLPIAALNSGGSRAAYQNLFSTLPPVVTDMWGWTDSATGREFALVGRAMSTAFVEVTDPVHPRYLGDLYEPEKAYEWFWRDIKVYQHYALIVADVFSPHGLQIFDLAQLRDWQGPPREWEATATYDGFLNAHNLAVNPETGYAYAAISSGGSVVCEGGLYMLDLRTPLQPTYAGCYADPATLGIHDAQCVVYRGPDRRYQHHELCFAAAGNAVSIADVTDKRRPKTIGLARYPHVTYALQGWLSEDQRYFFLSDATDRRAGAAAPARTLVFDLRDLTRPVVATEWHGAPTAASGTVTDPNGTVTDRNLYVRGPYLYQASAHAGLRVVDVHEPTAPREVGYFRTAVSHQPPNAGAWGVYPFFAHGVVGVTSTEDGVFFLRPTLPTPPPAAPTASPNP